MTNLIAYNSIILCFYKIIYGYFFNEKISFIGHLKDFAALIAYFDIQQEQQNNNFNKIQRKKIRKEKKSIRVKRIFFFFLIKKKI